jgi:uncharacterized membrane protein YvlD (DUF360 family)
MFRMFQMIINAILFLLVCHVFNDFQINQWQYWGTLGCLIGIGLNNSFNK